MIKISEWIDDTPTLIHDAIQRVLNGESVASACAWVWFQCSTQETRNAIDTWLISIGHPSATEPGTPERRFRLVVAEFVQEYQAGGTTCA